MRRRDMTAEEIAREHCDWCRRQGMSPAHVLRSVDVPRPTHRPANWTDAREAIEWVSRRDMFENMGLE